VIMLFVELRTCPPFLLLVIVGFPVWQLLLCFWIITVNPTLSLVMILEIKVGPLLAFSRSSRHVYALLLLIVCQESGNKLHSNAVHVQIFC
jgi:hypothetical protein